MLREFKIEEKVQEITQKYIYIVKATKLDEASKHLTVTLLKHQGWEMVRDLFQNECIVEQRNKYTKDIGRQ